MTYDFVIVGGGSAGSVLAARLSERPDVSVLLLEAGGADGPENMRDPSAWDRIAAGDIDWGYHTVPQPGLGGRSLHVPRGRVLGGSSAVNGMIHKRPDPTNLAAWVSAGATGWGSADLLPFFRRTETVEGGGPDRGTSGPMRPAPPVAEEGSFSASLVAAMRDEGRLADAEVHDLTIVDGRRQTVADAYLSPAVLARPNLTVRTGATVERLLVEAGRCTGVVIATGAGPERVHADREVLVAAGAIGSPHLLLRSGIGPAGHLAEVGVDVVLDSPGVGTGLQDHALQPVLLGPGAEPAGSAGQFAEVTAVLRTELAGAEPDVQLLSMSTGFHPPGAPVYPGFAFAVSVVAPDSIGSVRLAAPGSDVPPLIDPDVLGDQRDVQRIVTGLQVARDLAGAPGLDRFRGEWLLPAADAWAPEQLEGMIRQVASTYFHPYGSCRLGPGPEAPLDLELRVRGVAGLRVVDASVFPGHISTNPNATVLAVAERAAELIVAG